MKNCFERSFFTRFVSPEISASCKKYTLSNLIYILSVFVFTTNNVFDNKQYVCFYLNYASKYYFYIILKTKKRSRGPKGIFNM